MACPPGLSLSACRDYLMDQEQFFSYTTPQEWGWFGLKLLGAFCLASAFVFLEPIITDWWQRRKHG